MNPPTKRETIRRFPIPALLAFLATNPAPAQSPKTPAFDNALPTFHAQQNQRLTYPLSWLSGKYTDFDQWRADAKATLLNALLMPPPKAPPNPKTLHTEQRDGYQLRTMELNLSAYTRCEAFLLVPDGQGPFPAVLALHDHGAEFRWGKAKLVRTPHADHPDLQKFVARHYGNRFIADELAQRGYVVLAADAAFWGDRQHAGGSQYETQQAIGSSMMQLGMTWAGLILHEDLAAADFLASLPQVDPARIASVGLSMGAYRSWHVAALSDRINAGIAVGWMATNVSLMVPGNNQTRGQSAFSMLIPGLRRHLDYPDEAAIACPKPMLFYNGSKDPLFPTPGAQDAFDKMKKIWKSQNASDRLTTQLWPVPHEFNQEMQQKAFDWLDQHLTP
jgi:dienelactone hydrolase